MPSSTMPIEMPKHLLVHCNKVFSYIFIYTYTNSSTKYISEVGGHGHEKTDTGVHVHVTDMVMDMDTRILKIVTPVSTDL